MYKIYINVYFMCNIVTYINIHSTCKIYIECYMLLIIFNMYYITRYIMLYIIYNIK